MRRRGAIAVCVLCLIWTLASCGGTGPVACGDVLRGDFSAEVQGTLNGTAFSAGIEARTADAGREVVVTFYAPESVCGTVAVKRSDGSGYLQAGDVLLDGGGDGMAPLFDLFLKDFAVGDATLNESGHTVVRAEGLTLTLLPDGTPYRLTAPTADLTVISWQRR